ncbi:hypothetical protein AKJ55_00385 [candidate division MSBL1 archaeon SCGC-AAA382M17]|uniref:Membrane or secreted protein n=1 Tax=candidate division MSBL1 archaeon SCGC-AAA382M17 TaxID=1698284 RepID=A0ABR5TJY8_9EURY|nr:hypothetical protein AKJ55_00385 [candidate division MSBL1 archaeon SCGC-AAA382M17]
MLLAAIIIMLIALIGLSVRMLFKKQGKFHGGSCVNIPPELKEKDISCACGNEEKCSYTE